MGTKTNLEYVPETSNCPLEQPAHFVPDSDVLEIIDIPNVKKLSNIIKQKLTMDDGGYVYTGAAQLKLMIANEEELQALKNWAKLNCTKTFYAFENAFYCNIPSILNCSFCEARNRNSNSHHDSYCVLKKKQERQTLVSQSKENQQTRNPNEATSPVPQAVVTISIDETSPQETENGEAELKAAEEPAHKEVEQQPDHTQRDHSPQCNSLNESRSAEVSSVAENSSEKENKDPRVNENTEKVKTPTDPLEIDKMISKLRCQASDNNEDESTFESLGTIRKSKRNGKNKTNGKQQSTEKLLSTTENEHAASPPHHLELQRS